MWNCFRTEDPTMISPFFQLILKPVKRVHVCLGNRMLKIYNSRYNELAFSPTGHGDTFLVCPCKLDHFDLDQKVARPKVHLLRELTVTFSESHHMHLKDFMIYCL